jgi:hypothetical protein
LGKAAASNLSQHEGPTALPFIRLSHIRKEATVFRETADAKVLQDLEDVA